MHSRSSTLGDDFRQRSVVLSAELLSIPRRAPTAALADRVMHPASGLFRLFTLPLCVSEEHRTEFLCSSRDARLRAN